MSDGREAQGRSGLEVARIGGGRSARVGALAVVGVLLTVVGIGVSGRPPSAATAPESPELAIAAPPSAPTAAPPATETTSPPPTAASDTYGVSATIGLGRRHAILEEIRPGYLFAAIRVPFPAEAEEGTLEITQLSASGLAENPIAVSSWDLPLGPLASVNREPSIVIDESVPAQPRLRDVPPAVRSGYHLTVYAENDLLFGVLSIEMTIPVV